MKKIYLILSLLLIIFAQANSFAQTTILSDNFDSDLGDWVASNNGSQITYINDKGATANGAMQLSITASWKGAKDITIDMSSAATGTFNLTYKVRKVSGPGATATKAYVKQGGNNVASTQKVITSMPSSIGSDSDTWYTYSYDFEVLDVSQNLLIEIIIGGPDTATGTNIVLIDDIVVTGPEVLSNDKISTLDFNIYPNPVQNTLTVDAREAVNSIEVFDVLGKQVLTTQNSNSIDVSTLDKAIYFAQIQTDSGSSTKKFIKE